METDLKKIWENTLNIIKGEMSEVSFNTWIKSCEPISISSNTIKISVPNVFTQDILEKRYKDLVINSIYSACSKQYNVEFLTESEIQEANSNTPADSSEQSHKDSMSITVSDEMSSTLNPKYTFDSFVIGNSNRFAHAASLAVAESPAKAYNPLFIYGGPGLGKTHLLNAIGNKVLHDNPQARIKYITAENFINEFVVHIRLDKMDELKLKYRHLDVLLIDDIQSLAKKSTQATQEEFFNTFNVLHNNNKQIVLTSDRNPDQLNEMEERLVTRFKWGLTVNITPPDFETRVAILTNKIMDYDYHFPPETIEYLAGQFDSNVRDLEGALKDISLVANVRQLDTITVEVAAEAIRARKMDGPKLTLIPIEDIQTEVGKFYNVTVKEIKATKRTQNIVLARQVAMYLAREMTDNSLPKIGKEFGGRDHSTVLHAYNKIKNMIAQDDSLRIEIDTIKNKIK